MAAAGRVAAARRRRADPSGTSLTPRSGAAPGTARTAAVGGRTGSGSRSHPRSSTTRSSSPPGSHVSLSRPSRIRTTRSAIRAGPLVVADQHERGARRRAGRGRERVVDELRVLGVELTARLVGEHQGRPVRKGGGDGDPLRLAPGQRGHLAAAEVAGADGVQGHRARTRAAPASAPIRRCCSATFPRTSSSGRSVRVLCWSTQPSRPPARRPRRRAPPARRWLRRRRARPPPRGRPPAPARRRAGAAGSSCPSRSARARRRAPPAHGQRDPAQRHHGTVGQRVQAERVPHVHDRARRDRGRVMPRPQAAGGAAVRAATPPPRGCRRERHHEHCRPRAARRADARAGDERRPRGRRRSRDRDQASGEGGEHDPRDDAGGRGRAARPPRPATRARRAAFRAARRRPPRRTRPPRRRAAPRRPAGPAPRRRRAGSGGAPGQQIAGAAGDGSARSEASIGARCWTAGGRTARPRAPSRAGRRRSVQPQLDRLAGARRRDVHHPAQRADVEHGEGARHGREAGQHRDDSGLHRRAVEGEVEQPVAGTGRRRGIYGHRHGVAGRPGAARPCGEDRGADSAGRT